MTTLRSRIFPMVLLGLFVTLVSARADTPNKLVGRWQAKRVPGIPPAVEVIAEFTKDGGFTLAIGKDKKIEGKYSTSKGSEIRLSDLSEPVSGSKKHTLTYTISNKTLTLKDTSGKTTARFSRLDNE